MAEDKKEKKSTKTPEQIEAEKAAKIAKKAEMAAKAKDAIKGSEEAAPVEGKKGKGGKAKREEDSGEARGGGDEALGPQLEGGGGQDREEAVEDALADEAHGLGPRAVELDEVGDEEECGQGGRGEGEEEVGHRAGV